MFKCYSYCSSREEKYEIHTNVNRTSFNENTSFEDKNKNQKYLNEDEELFDYFNKYRRNDELNINFVTLLTQSKQIILDLIIEIESSKSLENLYLSDDLNLFYNKEGTSLNDEFSLKIIKMKVKKSNISKEISLEAFTNYVFV